MYRLAAVIFALAGPTLAGSLVIVTLASGYYTTDWVAGAGLTGFVLAIPVSLLIARRIIHNQRQNQK